jgi:hypothetical protein
MPTINTSQIRNDAITSAKIADDQVNSEHLAAGGIDAEHFAAGAVDTTALGADAVTSAKIADDQVDSEHLAAGGIDAEHFAAGAVDTTALGADAVTSAKIADDQVDSEHINGGALDSEHFSTGCIDTATFIAAGTITSTQIDSTVATTAYVDQVAQGLRVKKSVQFATTEHLFTSHSTSGAYASGQFTTMGQGTIDGVTLVATMRVLVKDQTDAKQNGLYVITTLGTSDDGTWDRVTDMDADAEVNGGDFTFVEFGAQANTGWVLQNDSSDLALTLDTDDLDWTQFNGAGAVSAGTGMTKSGNTMNVIGGDGITASADEIEVTVDDSTIELSASSGSGHIRVKDAGVTEAKMGLTTDFSVFMGNGSAGDTMVWVFNDNLTAQVDDGSPTTFTPTSAMYSGSEQVFLNGALQIGGGTDYTFTNSTTITFGSAPSGADTVVLNYIHQP